MGGGVMVNREITRSTKASLSFFLLVTRGLLWVGAGAILMRGLYDMHVIQC